MTTDTTRGPDGADMVMLTRDEYEELLDARGHAAAMQAVASGAMETLSEAETAGCLAAKAPLAFWRRRRGVTQRVLADAVGVSQAHVRRSRLACGRVDRSWCGRWLGCCG